MVGLLNISAADHFSLSTANITKDVDDGSFDFFDSFTVISSSNETITVSASVYGEPRLIFLPLNITLSPNSSSSLSASIAVPLSTLPGEYNFQINFTHGDEFREIGARLNVADRTFPEASGCSHSRQIVNRTSQVVFSCSSITDNINVSRSWIGFMGEEHDISGLSAAFVPNELGRFNTTLFVTDTSNNTANFTYGPIEVTPFDPIKIDNVDFLHVHTSQYHDRKIAAVLQDANISARSDLFRFRDTNQSVDFFLILPDQSLRSIPSNGATVNLGPIPAGDIFIRVQSDMEGDFLGSLSLFSADNEYGANIRGTFSSYTVLPNTTFLWFGHPVWCAGYDTGTYENSTTVCNLILPVSTTLNGSSLPVDFQLYNDLDLGNYDQTLLQLQRKADGELFWFIVSIILVVVLVLVASYLYLEQKDD